MASKPEGNSTDEIEITPQMIEAGEAVLDSALDCAGLPISYLVISAAREVYIAMQRAKSLRCD
jgi:hypothetical protein